MWLSQTAAPGGANSSARRKCLFLYYYFMGRDFGLIHVKLQTWFPLQIQVYVNGHEWLARKLKSLPMSAISRSSALPARGSNIASNKTG